MEVVVRCFSGAANNNNHLCTGVKPPSDKDEPETPKARIRILYREFYSSVRTLLIHVAVFAMLIVTIAYDLLLFAFSFVVGLVALIFYLDKKKSGKLQIGMLLIAIAFLVSSFLGLLNGITVTTYLSDQGWEAQQIGLYSTIVGLVSRISFTIMILTGLYILHKETT